LAEASPAGPIRESNPKSKMTLALAFEGTKTEKFAYLKEYIEWEKEKEKKTESSGKRINMIKTLCKRIMEPKLRLNLLE
jgi:hypothetical protein